MTHSDDITSVSHDRSRQAEFHARLKVNRRPLFLTRRGETEAVVLSPADYDELLDRAQAPEILAAIEAAEASFAAGRSISRGEARRVLRERLGLPAE